MQDEERDSRRTIKVLLADDHTMFRQGLAGVLHGYAGMEVVGQTNNDEEAVELAHLTKPDVVLMQVQMPISRAKTTERTRRGRLRRAREGKIVPGNLPDYGLRFNAARDNYEVEEETMAVVRRMFYLVRMEGVPMYRVKKIFEGEGIRSPQGKRFWNSYFIRTRILDDVYKPHTHEEISNLVSSEVAARLDLTKSYNIWWFNRRRTRRVQVSEPSPNGRLYRKRGRVTMKQKDEWIAVPVPSADIPREWVDAAREAIRDNRRPSSAGYVSGSYLATSSVVAGVGAPCTPTRSNRRVGNATIVVPPACTMDRTCVP